MGTVTWINVHIALGHLLDTLAGCACPDTCRDHMENSHGKDRKLKRFGKTRIIEEGAMCDLLGCPGQLEQFHFLKKMTKDF